MTFTKLSRRSGAGLLLLLDCLCMSAAPATAHEFWLEPTTFAPAAAPDESLLIAAYVGTGFRGDVLPYAPTHSVRLAARQSRETDLREGAVNGDLYLAAVAPDAGGCLVSFVSSFTSIQLPAAEFDRYLALEGLDGPLAARKAEGGAKPGRERYRRCAKTWIRGADSRRVTTPVGIPLEIVPLADPALPGPLTVRVLIGGKPLAETLVRAWNQPLENGSAPREQASRDSVSAAASVRTDAAGLATLALDRPGEWLLSAIHMVPCREATEADWESTWASLTFARLTK